VGEGEREGGWWGGQESRAGGGRQSVTELVRVQAAHGVHGCLIQASREQQIYYTMVEVRIQEERQAYAS